MDEHLQHLDTLKDIKRMMERSSRFISLSGLSGIAAGVCALIGAWLANNVIHNDAQYGSRSEVRSCVIPIMRTWKTDQICRLI